MKAEELQIGDWVSYKGNPIMVFEIDEPEHNINTEQDGYNAIRCISIDEIQPIPITPEILEKNGFIKDERNEKMYTWNWGVIDDCISYDKETGIVHIFYVSGLAFKKILMYVHQLQQAMRLCEIGKEIIVEDKE